MKSELNDDFIDCFHKLPEAIKRKARKNYQLWKQDPSHPSLHFKKVHRVKPIYSVRVGIGWRALGVKSNNVIVWFWIGSHNDYETLLASL